MSPIHFGIIVVVNLCIRLCMHSVGSTLFTDYSVAILKIQNLIRPMRPFFCRIGCAITRNYEYPTIRFIFYLDYLSYIRSLIRMVSTPLNFMFLRPIK